MLFWVHQERVWKKGRSTGRQPRSRYKQLGTCVVVNEAGTKGVGEGHSVTFGSHVHSYLLG